MKFSLQWMACLVLALGTPGAPADDRFHARFSEDLHMVNAELCFDGAPPDRLYRSTRAADHASAVHHGGGPLRTVQDGMALELPPLPPDACLSWSYDLGAALDEGGYRTAMAVGDSVVSVTTLWFWKGPWRRPLVAEVTVPEGMAFSTSWPRDTRNPDRYRPVRTPAGWTSRSAVGPFTLETLDVAGGTVSLALLGDLSAAQEEKFTRWIRNTTEAVAPVFGAFPRRHTQVVVVPIGRRGEAVPWAHVLRGGGPSVQFYVDEHRPLGEFTGDWTATHEFAHLLLPYVSREDRWLSEGLASYYQNVLRARDGRLTERKAWQELVEGFRRGQGATRPETLAEATRLGRSRTMRIYWSGAAMMLQADTALRERTGGAWTLDRALARFRDCCSEEGRMWRAREVLATLDRLSGTDVFMKVFEDNVNRMAFPKMDDTFDALGLETDGGRVRLSDQAPLASVRRDIMSGAPGDSLPVAAAENAP